MIAALKKITLRNLPLVVRKLFFGALIKPIKYNVVWILHMDRGNGRECETCI